MQRSFLLIPHRLHRCSGAIAPCRHGPRGPNRPRAGRRPGIRAPPPYRTDGSRHRRQSPARHKARASRGRAPLARRPDPSATTLRRSSSGRRGTSRPAGQPWGGQTGPATVPERDPPRSRPWHISASPRPAHPWPRHEWEFQSPARRCRRCARRLSRLATASAARQRRWAHRGSSPPPHHSGRDRPVHAPHRGCLRTACR